ncbi:MAG: dTDP-4-dehydrorhamnose 3,5-epimerase [Bacteroidia bacterium]|nr:dTDP-4-dehydrorhamnose 3,5-epimerase [Bacteroidia bacterium]MDW8158380.1 dTDP-4-dehydrorhamnose 3,5-epimerase [Bacteroidia bacterium]
MDVSYPSLSGLVVIKPAVFRDSRGYFLEAFNQKAYKEIGIQCAFVQDNLSYSTYGVLRGLHFQAPPYGQAKLVSVLQGKVLDVAVDIRKNSPTYGKYFSIFLDASEPTYFFIPEGFAHGFVVLSPTCLFHYKCSNYYHKPSEGGLLWNDPDLAIDWPITEPILSEKDQLYPSFKSFVSPFD